jgi:hypothetical protein
MRTIIVGAVVALALTGPASAKVLWSGNHFLPACRAFLSEKWSSDMSPVRAYEEGE